MSLEAIGRFVVYLAFAHAFVAFDWAFYWQIKLIGTLLYNTASLIRAGQSSLEARSRALSSLFNDERYTELRRNWGRAVLWVIFAFVLVFALVGWIAPSGIN
ncbi:hypothetical protein GCM10007385_04760 [Tateyamaria omphalii]|uniref:hypothetical protein n=1 Tax=Tateyamaria omphalii TaxID=299262 RepID=UPI001671CE01|nr:hypothetical protein [Tateyamaria omphalii]GGX40434.1 hypothetical protein GCM10007385_04760 [Tateyamaria omphalii]